METTLFAVLALLDVATLDVVSMRWAMSEALNMGLVTFAEWHAVSDMLTRWQFAR